MTNLFFEKHQCTGCHSCYSICPKQAVSMVYDKEGFLYPSIDPQKCINCHLCEQVCPIHQQRCVPSKLPDAYAAICNCKDIRCNSSSGGVFPLLSEYILQKGGAVFGAVHTVDFHAVEHCAAFNLEDNIPQRCSKYLQSRIGDTFKQAKTLLENGKPVLFTGTPCQISGLYTYLGKDYENLYTQDLICHGVPSPLAWKKYICELEKKTDGKARKVFFRNKERGWRNFSLRIEFNRHPAYSRGLFEDAYLKGFMSDLFLRPSCYHCAYKTINRQADITLADFWGIEHVWPEIDDDLGVSLVYIHSDKGQELLNAIENSLLLKPIDARIGAQYNPAMTKSAQYPKHRDQFMLDLEQFTFAKLAKKYWMPSSLSKLRNHIRRIVKG